MLMIKLDMMVLRTGKSRASTVPSSSARSRSPATRTPSPHRPPRAHACVARSEPIAGAPRGHLHVDTAAATRFPFGIPSAGLVVPVNSPKLYSLLSSQ
jgi:hypothetical protein